MKALRDLSGLQLDQTAPFTAQERARIGLRDDDEAGIILPVPPSAGRLSFKHKGATPIIVLPVLRIDMPNQEGKDAIQQHDRGPLG